MADEASLWLLRLLCGELAFVLGTVRDSLAELGGMAGVAVLRLEPLDRAELLPGEDPALLTGRAGSRSTGWPLTRRGSPPSNP